MGRVRGRFAAQEREVAADAADAAMERAGIAAVGDVANDETAFGVKSRSRMRYHTFAEVFGLHTTDARGVRGLLRHPATSLTPHSLYSLQDGVLRSLAAEGDGPLSIHFMESPAEGELFERPGGVVGVVRTGRIHMRFPGLRLPGEAAGGERAARPERRAGT